MITHLNLNICNIVHFLHSQTTSAENTPKKEAISVSKLLPVFSLLCICRFVYVWILIYILFYFVSVAKHRIRTAILKRLPLGLTRR